MNEQQMQKVGRAVDAYRKMAKAELASARAEREVQVHVMGLNGEEVDEYVRLTTDIDERVAQVEDDAERAFPGWAESTRKQRESQALSMGGRWDRR